MKSPLASVFLSSTIYDLKDLRNAVQTALIEKGYSVLASEAGSIPIDSTKHSYEICLEAARKCDCLIAIIDGRFGGVMPDKETSITLAEIEAALEKRRHVLAFVRQGVWDAMEVCKTYMKAGFPFVANKLVEDARVFDVIDAIRRRTTGNWLFQFNLPADLIRTVLFQLESLEATKLDELIGWRGDGKAKGDVVQLKDMSNSTAKRYSAFVLIERPRRKEAIHELVAAVTEQLKTETYQRPGPMKELWAKERAHVIWTYVGTSVEDISRGNWLCRSLWIDPNADAALTIHPLGGDEKVGGIEFIWNTDYAANKEFAEAHRVSKGEVMDRVESLAVPLLNYADMAKECFAKFNQNEMSEEKLASILQSRCDEVRELYHRCSDLPFGPADTNEVVDLCNLMGGSVDELFDSYSVRWMKERDTTSRRVRFEMALSTLKQDQKRWDVAWEKVHHG